MRLQSTDLVESVALTTAEQALAQPPAENLALADNLGSNPLPDKLEARLRTQHPEAIRVLAGADRITKVQRRCSLEEAPK